MALEDGFFGPHQDETYRQYLSRLRDDSSMTASRAAALMATAMLMQGKPNQAVDQEKFYELTRKLKQQPAFRLMMRDGKAKTLLRSGNGGGLIGLMADKETERQRSFEPYRRPREYVQEDARILSDAIEGLKKHAPADGAAGIGDPELEKRGKLYEEMMKRLDQARSLAENGVQLSGEQAKELVSAVKKYNDAGKKDLPGGEKEAEGHLEAMCLLSRYMPEKSFRSYCRKMNEARGITEPEQPGYTDPEAFLPGRMNGGAKTAKEWYADAQQRLIRGFSPEAAAEAAAIRKLSGGNPNKAINKEDLELETKRLCEPGSAFVRTMRDDEARQVFVHLAATGRAQELGTNILTAARKHTAGTAQGQVNRSIRELTSGPVNAFVAAENLANILAARELAFRDDAGEQLTNGAFRARAQQILSDPAFQRMARRYSEDPTFRRRMNQEFAKDSSGKALQNVYKRVSDPKSEQPELENNAAQQEPVAN